MYCKAAPVSSGREVLCYCPQKTGLPAHFHFYLHFPARTFRFFPNNITVNGVSDPHQAAHHVETAMDVNSRRLARTQTPVMA